MDSQPAQRLVEAARRGNRAAAVELVEAFYERIYAFLRRFAGNEADAADLTAHFRAGVAVSADIRRPIFDQFVDAWYRLSRLR